jgi:DNA-binding NarL/FixJ family response regulator
MNSDLATGAVMPQPIEEETTGIRVILADSQAIYRVGIRKVFALEDDIRVVAQAETLENLFAALQRFPTDVVILEGHLIAGTVDAIPEFMRRAPDAKLIVQVSASDETNTVELYRRGVRGVVSRLISPDLLVKCVRKIAAGETWIDNQSVSWVIDAYRAQAATDEPEVATTVVGQRALDHYVHHARDAEQRDCVPDWHDGAGDQELPAEDL